MGRISPYSKALIHEVHEELKAPLLWEADTYAEDLPYWVDIPAEKGSAEPKGMLMIPYRCVNPLNFQYSSPTKWTNQLTQIPSATTATTSNTAPLTAGVP